LINVLIKNNSHILIFSIFIYIYINLIFNIFVSLLLISL